MNSFATTFFITSLFAIGACVTTEPTVNYTISVDGKAPPKTFFWDNGALAKFHQELAKGLQSDSRRVVEKIASTSLNCGPFSVTAKTGVPPSGDKHDFMSLAPYWWPNPQTKSGLPYLKRDGETNPETQKFGDEIIFQKFTSCLERLSISAYLLDDNRAGSHASEIIRAWFIDPTTRMNPNLRFSEGIIGKTTGRGVGTNVGREFLRIIDSIILLRSARQISDGDYSCLLKWFSEYFSWLRDSKEGREAAEEDGNIRVIYFAQVVAAAVFIDRLDEARKTLTQVYPKLVTDLVLPDGRQPMELARTRSWNYSHTALRHFFYLAMLGDRLNFQKRLWDFQTDDGRGILMALNFLIPYAQGRATWPYKQIDLFDPARTGPFLITAAKVWGIVQYQTIGRQLLQSASVEDGLLAELGSLKPPT